MYWNRSATDIAAAWQAETESKLEVGATALLLAGAPDTLTSSAATLLALQHNTRQRNDIATPWLVAGGNSAAWLGLLLAPQPRSNDPDTPAPSPAPEVVFGGADEATYLATVSLTAAQSAQSLGMLRPMTTLEMGMQLAPRLQPGAATPWEMLPLLEVGEQPAGAPPTAYHLAAGHAGADPTTEWIAWGVMLFVFCLVLSALLI